MASPRPTPESGGGLPNHTPHTKQAGKPQRTCPPCRTRYPVPGTRLCYSGVVAFSPLTTEAEMAAAEPLVGMPSSVTLLAVRVSPAVA